MLIITISTPHELGCAKPQHTLVQPLRDEIELGVAGV